MKRTMLWAIAALGTCALPLQSEAAHRHSAPAADAQAISAAVAASDRPAADHERDAWSKPETVLNFLGARAGMHVIDYFGGDGYYSELLAHVVGDKGQVILFNNGGYAGYFGQALVKRFSGRHVPHVVQRVSEISDLKLAPHSLDAALFVMSYHDVYFKPPGAAQPMADEQQMLKTLFEALIPGGIIVVQDHVANADRGTAEVVNALHRINPDAVKHAFEAVGFKFDGESDVFRNATDDHSKLVFDPSIRHKTDQFLYRFRKPGKH